MGACELERGDVALTAIPIRKTTIGVAQTLLLIIDWRIAMPKRTTGNRPELKPVNVGAAAIEIGSKMHMAAVNPASADEPVRSFGTFTQDLHDLADWFKTCGVTSVAHMSCDWSLTRFDINLPLATMVANGGIDLLRGRTRHK